MAPLLVGALNYRTRSSKELSFVRCADVPGTTPCCSSFIKDGGGGQAETVDGTDGRRRVGVIISVDGARRRTCLTGGFGTS